MLLICRVSSLSLRVLFFAPEMIKSLLTTWEIISKPEETSLLRLLVKLEFIIGITIRQKIRQKTKDK